MAQQWLLHERWGSARCRVFLVDREPLELVILRSLAAADTHIAVLAADDQLEVALPLDDD